MYRFHLTVITQSIKGILATVTAGTKIGGEVDILLVGHELSSTVGKEASTIAGEVTYSVTCEINDQFHSNDSPVSAICNFNLTDVNRQNLTIKI